MKRDFLYISLIASSVLAMTACTDDDATTNAEIGNKTPISLFVGNSNGGNITRAITTPVSENKLSTLPEGTQLFLMMRSDYVGTDGLKASKYTLTKGVTGEPDATTKASSVEFSTAGTPRYWDDIFARESAVAVYGICTPGGTPNTPTIGGKNTYSYTSSPTTGAWTTSEIALTMTDWTVGTNQASLTAKTFADQDLCYTNNVSVHNGTDDRLKYVDGHFQEGDIYFYHALTKVTINMTAGDGFNGSFVGEPTATLHGFNTKGDFNIETGLVSNQGTPASDMTTYCTNETKTGQETVTRSAIIMPGRTLASNDAILTVSADGNTYNVTAAQIYDAMPADKTMQQGTEYVINVRINKTDVKVAAYVKAWDILESELVTPKIDITTSYGDADGDAKDDDFSLYYTDSDNGAKGYGTGDGPYAANATVTKSGDIWTMTPQIYWDNHTTGYYFRAVWPKTGAGDGAPKVVLSGDNQVIAISNQPYTAGTYPSDLMIGIPSDEPSDGITATKGTINLTFKYIMSQVEVNLSTTDDDSKVDLLNATVELVNAYTDANVLMKNRSITYTGEATTDALDPVEGSSNKYLSAIVPQELTYTVAGATTNLRFKITVTNSDGTKDVYYADINPICKKNTTTKIAPEGKWESGVKYVYNLKVSKTKVNVSATIENWKETEGSEGIWF